MFNSNNNFSKSTHVGYIVQLDGEGIIMSKDYLFALAVCQAWRRNFPREDKHRIKMVSVGLD